MVGETVEGCTGQQIIGEDFTPLFKGAVAGDDQRTLLIALGNDLIEILSRLGRNGLEAEIIQEQYREYQSWRGDVQMIFTYVWDWKCATSGGERVAARQHILNVMVRANKTAELFPTQSMPDDIISPRGDKPFINIAELLADLHVILD
jgi:hypothetical protein